MKNNSRQKPKQKHKKNQKKATKINKLTTKKLGKKPKKTKKTIDEQTKGKIRRDETTTNTPNEQKKTENHEAQKTEEKH